MHTRRWGFAPFFEPFLRVGIFQADSEAVPVPAQVIQAVGQPTKEEMKSYYDIWDLFYDRTFVGDVLRYSTLLEFELDAVITQYFIRPDRCEDAMEDLLPKLTFGIKLDILSHLPIRMSLISRRQAIMGLRRFQKIRNIVAHNPSISQSKAKLLANDVNYRNILQEYPEGMVKEFRLTRNSLSRLLRVREFRNPQCNEVIDPWKISFDKWVS